MTDVGVGLLLSGLGVPFFGLGATLFFWLMRRPWNRAKRNMQRGGVAEGEVVSYENKGFTKSGKPTLALVVEYRDQSNQVFRTVSNMAASRPKPVGTRLQVAYDLSNPGGGVLIGGARTLAIVGTSVGALFALLATTCAVVFVLLLF